MKRQTHPQAKQQKITYYEVSNEWSDQLVSSSEAAEMTGCYNDPGELPGGGSLQRWAECEQRRK